MDYVTKYHLWKPLAAISDNDVMSDLELPQFLHKPTSTSASVALSATITSSMARVTAHHTYDDNSNLEPTSTLTTTTTTVEDDIWYKIVFNADSNSIFTRLNDSIVNSDIMESYLASAAGVGLNGQGNVTGNVTGNASGFANVTFVGDGGMGESEYFWEMVTMAGTAVLLGLIILATVIGNVFVIAAILLERHLQNVANYLILSLAVADLLVACLVMPLGAVYEVSHQWTLGPELCDMWTSSDVLCCTASILHLVAIALDRYWAVTNIDYIHHRTAKRIGIMILIVWLVAFLVCIAPLLGWKDPDWTTRVQLDNECIVSQDIGYQIFATASSFYLPLLVILLLYWRIFQTARKRIRRRQVIANATAAAVAAKENPAVGGIAGGLAAASGTGGIAAAVVTIIGRPLPTISETTTTAFTNVSSNNTSPEKTSCANGLEVDPPTTTDGGGPPGYHPPPSSYPVKRKSKDSADSKRERKAAKTLAIITGAFVVCWLPFFVMAVLLPVYKDLFGAYLVSAFLWLGYFNSTLNPIIYTIFSPEFRHAFKKILFGRNYVARRRHKQYGVRQLQ